MIRHVCIFLANNIGGATRVREISREIGNLAMQRMQERQDRWRSKTTENPKLKNLQHHQVNSAIEMVVNEGLESML